MATEKQAGMVKFGTFTVKGGCLYAVDPFCSSEGVSLTECPRGKWDAYENLQNQGAWGFRAVNLTVVPEGVDPEGLEFTEDMGTVYVDAGTAGFFDLTDVDDFADEGRDTDWPDGIRPYGAQCTSGFGDGVYAVFVARNDSGDILGAQIVFIPEEDDPRYAE